MCIHETCLMDPRKNPVILSQNEGLLTSKSCFAWVWPWLRTNITCKSIERLWYFFTSKKVKLFVWFIKNFQIQIKLLLIKIKPPKRKKERNAKLHDPVVANSWSNFTARKYCAIPWKYLILTNFPNYATFNGFTAEMFLNYVITTSIYSITFSDISLSLVIYSHYKILIPNMIPMNTLLL